MLPEDTLMTEPQAAEFLGGPGNALSVKTLQAWRISGRGPRYCKLGVGSKAPVRYRLSELRRWLAECERTSTAGPG